MLSRNAFNALLKTLEEPPAHVKFLFATTEVDKLPVTVLSRTQRFDLRRIPAELLHQHFASVCRQEGVEAEEEALAMVAAAAEGSVRDGLSILDQAIAHADMEGDEHRTLVRAERVRDMLGLADKGAQRRLFEALLEGDPQGLLEAVDRQYALGVDPLALMRGMMELTHRIAVTQVGQGEADAPTVEERQAIGEWAQRLSAGQVHRLWQLLLKGHDEVRGAPDPLAAAQMALLRALHAADMPDPGKLAKTLEQMAEQQRNAPAPSSGEGSGAPAAIAQARHVDWSELVDQVDRSHLDNAMTLATVLRMQVRVIALEEGRLVYTQPPGFDENLAPQIRQALGTVTGQAWEVEKGEGEGARTLVEQEEAAEQAERDRIRESPLVNAALAAFPDAEFVEDEEDAPRGRPNWSKRA
jgi:DNA polymerase-3 subunit gamma/tau